MFTPRATKWVCAAVIVVGFSPGIGVAAASSAAAEQVSVLAEEFYNARAQFDPMNYATANGDSRFDDQIGMSIAPKVRADYFAHIHSLQNRLTTIPRAGLSRAENLNEDILVFELNSSIDLEQFPENLLPISQMDNVPSALANYASGTGSQPLTTPTQYRAYLRRIQQLPAWIDQAVANMREGMRTGVVQPKAITLAMIPQFSQLLSATPEANIFYAPIRSVPQQFSNDDKRQLADAYRGLIVKQLSPALQRLNDFLKDEYLPASRASSGLGALPNGAAWYLARIRNNTNLALSPAAIHELGLKEVARIQQRFAELGPRLGYGGPPAKLPQWVFEQKKFKPFTSDSQVLEAYRRIYAQVNEKLPEYFHILPKARLSLQLEPELTRATGLRSLHANGS